MNTERPLRDSPALVATFALEQLPALSVVADNEADYIRLRSWLLRSGLLDRIFEVVEEREAA